MHMEILDPDECEFSVPRKAVTKVADMEIWEKSVAYAEYVGFITAMNDVVMSKPNRRLSEPAIIRAVLDILEILDRWLTENPPIEQPQRFGNKAFRNWWCKLKEEAAALLRRALPPKFHRAIAEIKEYLIESFGNATRIDYGTGHEMAFCMFLYCLFKIGAFTQDDTLQVIFLVFNRYLELVRRLQIVYKMEPAGSRGVWALDDYQFIPFIWGSSQLMENPRIEPRHFVDEGIIETYHNEYMFLGCIKFINEVKKGPFAEHSNQLWNISAVPYWSKINQGLIRMYKAEVLAKFPVIQHVLFGSILPFKINRVTQQISVEVNDVAKPE